MRLIYISFIGLRIRYDIILRGAVLQTALMRVFVLPKRAICVVAGVNRQTLCRTF